MLIKGLEDKELENDDAPPDPRRAGRRPPGKTSLFTSRSSNSTFFRSFHPPHGVFRPPNPRRVSIFFGLVFLMQKLLLRPGANELGFILTHDMVAVVFLAIVGGIVYPIRK
jgi:hypothetical protein